ncbi:purine catabolism regulator [Thermocatellispora tengchongensis]|uniref:Purine catabolism regulator n=1 Tax=Thermocatellispora tengchongensis TaxID=1073253 RepID=A0A840PF58_9ACTN|nr:PucR family transcriptional regulator [Thermocatellispora tengchongensis]MBB5135787.1 purine catabolism regulator [Thermocatellispora tengchongensis]
MPKLAELSRTLGPDLYPAVGHRPLPDREVTGVHVSELTDPTPYLEGGELLLTTGMGLTGQAAQAHSYAARLAAGGVAALGIGLGPVHREVPATLLEACEAAGVPLLVVPDPTPFLLVARTYWRLLAAAGQEELNATLGAHRDLVRAAAGPDPVAAVVRTLASAVEGWAAQLTPEGGLVAVWPREREGSARQIAGVLGRLRAAGPHSSATLPIDGDDVVVQPLSTRDRLTGFVATGCPPPMKAHDRQLVLAACSLLALQTEQRRRGTAGPRAARGSVARLLMLGHPDAARALAADIGLPAPPSRLRALAVTGVGTAGPDLLDHIEQAAGTTRPRTPGPGAGAIRSLATAEPDEVWVLAPAPEAEAARDAAAEFAAARVPGARAVLSREIAARDLALHMPALRSALARTPEGRVRDLAADADPVAAAPALEPLLAYTRADLVGAVVAYLRHRGQWEGAAKELAVHRNTLRHRIGTAARVLGADLDDPDVASSLWLALRARGLA